MGSAEDEHPGIRRGRQRQAQRSPWRCSDRGAGTGEVAVLTRAHLAWLTGSVLATAIYLYLRRDGMPFVLFGRDITVINLGEAGALLLAASSLYVFRKRVFIGVAGHLDAWLWAHVYLSLMGLLLIW